MREPNENESSRWWEFYFVRYAMGTVTGAIVFFFLCLANPVLKPLLFGTDSGTLDGARLALLASYGLAYCYIASAPILVFHVGRYRLDTTEPTTNLCQQLLPLVGIPLAATAIFYFTQMIGNESWLFLTSVFAFGMTLLWPQYVIIWRAIFGRKKLFDFYQKLANKRSKATPGGIVDSYKHMREHGNSFAIVLMEIVLAVFLYAVGSFEVQSSGGVASINNSILPYVLVVILWVLPAALVWFVGTLFEREFSGG